MHRDVRARIQAAALLPADETMQRSAKEIADGTFTVRETNFKADVLALFDSRLEDTTLSANDRATVAMLRARVEIEL